MEQEELFSTPTVNRLFMEDKWEGEQLPPLVFPTPAWHELRLASMWIPEASACRTHAGVAYKIPSPRISDMET